jgi:hypothetical protein
MTVLATYPPKSILQKTTLYARLKIFEKSSHAIFSMNTIVILIQFRILMPVEKPDAEIL